MFRRNSAGATDGKAQGSQGAQTPEAPAKSRPAAEAAKGRPIDVLNGIAYDAQHDRLFVTGKRWPKLFEITLLPPRAR